MYSEYQNQILTKLYPYNEFQINDLCLNNSFSACEEALKVLRKANLICSFTATLYGPTMYRLTEHGRACVEEVKLNKRRTVHDWINTGIAFGALVVAILAYIKK